MNNGTINMPKAKEIKTRPVKEETVSPKDFLKIPREDIEKTRIIPPRIGSKSLGKIRVVYKHLKYKPV